jgi:hypothetical protein
LLVYYHHFLWPSQFVLILMNVELNFLILPDAYRYLILFYGVQRSVWQCFLMFIYK